ncbi:MAG: hypothetical protein EOO52_18260 [Gammaproteobacteria bacterium]|nr:MAG: hypothetical protein EOO52_18260 [Gammaproteobacteria bacterium]
MSYHIQILRKRNGKLDSILKSEIEKLVKQMPNFRIESPSLSSAELDLIMLKNGVDKYRLTLQNGQLWAKNPDEVLIQAMIDMSKYLGARVRGDNLETYESLGVTYIHADDNLEFHSGQKTSDFYLKRHKRIKSFWWFVRFFLVLMFLLSVFISYNK